MSLGKLKLATINTDRIPEAESQIISPSLEYFPKLKRNE